MACSIKLLKISAKLCVYSRDGHLVGGGGDGRLLHAGGLLEAGGRLLEARGRLLHARRLLEVGRLLHAGRLLEISSLLLLK